MGFRAAPKWNAITGMPKIGVVSSWILLYVFWGAVAVLPFGFNEDSPAMWAVGGMFSMLLISKVWLWISPPKTRYFDENGSP